MTEMKCINGLTRDDINLLTSMDIPLKIITVYINGTIDVKLESDSDFNKACKLLGLGADAACR